mmetsp:Transcript_6092/g.17999  ORF Transcript_6092/g.17999 Transcript_6092/m.17999 type:complete len:207 (-) Transcript_6092:40-660(-)
MSAVSAMASAIWNLALASYAARRRRRPAGQMTMDTSTARQTALYVWSRSRPSPSRRRAAAAMRKENSPHSPQAKARIQKWSASSGRAKQPIASLPRIAQKRSPALASVPAFHMALTGIAKPMVAAKKRRRSQCMTRFTCRSHVACTAWSEQKQKPARKAPRSSEESEYLHAGTRTRAAASTQPSTAFGREFCGNLGRSRFSMMWGM